MAGIGSTPALIVGTAVGAAASAAFEPALEIPRQEAWQSAPNRLPDIGLIAELVAGGKVTLADGRAMAKRLGFNQGAFDSITWLTQNRADFAVMLRMWRLSAVNPAFPEAELSKLVDETLAHDRLDWEYQPFLRALKTAELPGIGDIAYGVVRGILPAPSWVPVAPPTTTTKVKRFPIVDIDPVKLAEALGYDEDMLKLLVGRSGLSLAPGLAAQAYFRQLIADDDYHLAIAEGDLRTEWADVLRDASRQILTSDQYVEAWLRGWIDQPTAEAGAALHGMSPGDTDLLHKIKGRPVTFHEITTGLARGGTYPSTYDDIPEPYRKSIQEADIRPEWASLHYANRYTYPSAFVLRTLAQAGDLGDQAAVEQVLLELGWKPSFAKQVSTAWTTTATAADPHIVKAQNQLWTTTHALHKKGTITDAQATAALPHAGVDPAIIPQILAIWDVENVLENGGTPT